MSLRRASAMKWNRIITVLLVVASSTAGIASADNVSFDSSYCDGKASTVSGEGSKAQVTAHSQVFSRAFASACPSESSLITYIGTSDQNGLTAIKNRTIGFAGTDAPLTTLQKTQMEAVLGRASLVHQIPMYVEGWAIAYYLPFCPGPPINFRSRVLGMIFSGQITTWDHPLLLEANPWLSTCRNKSIQLTKRQDKAGSTRAFQDYLTKRNPEWFQYSRGIASQEWPTLVFACSGDGEEGMASCVGQRDGAIGYVGMGIAAENGLTVGRVENASTLFVSPSPQTCTEAANLSLTPPGTPGISIPPTFEGYPTSVPPIPPTTGDWSAVSMTDTPGVNTYPICAYSYEIVFQQWFGAYGRDGNFNGRALRTLVDYLTVALSPTTQAQLPGIGLTPLPERIRQAGLDGVKAVSFANFTPAGI